MILAGGQSRRYGANKAFMPLAGQSLINHVLGRVVSQVDGLLISAGGDPRFAALGFPVVNDTLHERDGGQAGPLAGILAALDWLAEHRPDAEWLATFSVDTPLLPADLVARLRAAAARQGAPLACGRCGGRLHPLLALWSLHLRGDLRAALLRGERAVHRVIEGQGAAVVDFAGEPFDPFVNINTPADLAEVERQVDAQADK